MPSVPARSEGSEPFSAVTVVGLGAMGGSLARALAAAGRPPTGWSPEPGERREAAESGALRSAPATLLEAVNGSDLVVLAAPLDVVCRLTRELGGAAGPETVFSDVASLKAPVQAAARDAGLRARWVGGHPMAGTEASGFSAAREGLYRDARVWLVADREADIALQRVSAFWSRLGSRPERIDAGRHDRLMALVSHLPQLASNVLARVLSAADVMPGELGPGGLEATRLAASSPAIWREILGHASPELARALRALGSEATSLAELVESGDFDTVEELMEQTRAWRKEG